MSITVALISVILSAVMAMRFLDDETAVDSGTEVINLTSESYGYVLQTNSSFTFTCCCELEYTPSAGVILKVPWHI